MKLLKQYIKEQTSNKEKLTKKLNQWKKDLRRMTKLYKSLKAEDSPQAIKKFQEAQKHWVIFQKNWEKWYMQELIKSSTDKDETYYREQVRIMAWRAEMAINSILPTQYDSKTGSHVQPAPWLLDNPRYSKGDTRKNKILVYQKAFKKAFDAIEDLINYEADDVNLIKDTEQLSIAGINVLVSGKKEKDNKWTEKVTKQFIQILPTAVQLIKKSGLDLPLKGLTIEVTLSGAKSVGVQSGAGGSYDYGRDWLRMYPMGIGSKNDGIKTFVHELGHRYYYKNLKERVRNAWDKGIQKRQVEVKEHHVDEFFAKYVRDIDEKFNRKATEAIIKKNEKDPTLQRIYIHLVHNFPRWYVDDEDKRTNYIRKMKEYYTEWIDLEFVTDYAATKPNEAFAEVFAHWVIKRNTLGEWTRSFFKEIVRSGGANIREEKLINKYLKVEDISKLF